MEALIIACAAVAIILIVLWLMRWYGRRRSTAADAHSDGKDLAAVVVVDLPQEQRTSFVAALADRIADPIRTGAGAHRSMVPPASSAANGRDQIVINARSGAVTLDAVLEELRIRGYRVEATEGREIVLAGWAGVEAKILVRGVARDAD